MCVCTQVRSTEENLTLARHWLADSARLRKAIRHAMTTARTLEHDAARTLNVAMLAKLNSTEHLKENINAQLAKVGGNEATVTHAQAFMHACRF